MPKIVWVKSSAAFFILIMMLLLTLFYILVVPPEVREELLPPITPNETIILLDTTPGLLSKTHEVLGIKKIPLNEVLVDNTLATHKQLVGNQFTIKSTAFKSTTADFTFVVNKRDLQEASLELQVYATSGNGELIVALNGHVIFSNRVRAGEALTLRLPLAQVKDGVNIVEFSTPSPGLAFWQTNTYVVLDLNLVTTEYSSDTSSVEQVFTITSSEMSSTRDAKLLAYVIKQSQEPANLELALNGERLFKAVPTINLDLVIPTGLLRQGPNTLMWSVDRDGKYQIKFIQLSVETIKITGKETDYFFRIGNLDWADIQRDKYTCELYILKDFGDNSINVKLNGNLHKYAFNENGEVVQDVCDELLQGRNEIRLSAEDELRVGKVTVKLKSK